jgi:hypothetical protein
MKWFCKVALRWLAGRVDKDGNGRAKLLDFGGEKKHHRDQRMGNQEWANSAVVTA